MKKSQRVALFGDTLLMDSVEASLNTHNELDLVRINTEVANIVEHIKLICPDLVIFDANDPQAQFVLLFCRAQSSTPLLGLDIRCSQVVSLSYKHYSAQSANDLTNLIKGRLLTETGS